MWPVATDYANYREPRVPKRFIRYTCGHRNYEEYLRSGFEVASMFNLALTKTFGRIMSDYTHALDFGCGSGRLARFVNPQHLSGCDVNGPLVEFCRKTMPHGRFHQNQLMPPLPYEDSTFDLIYSFSVFSHLRQDVENTWLAELARVGAPGCVYLLTIQGDWMIEATLGAEADLARAEGFHFRRVHSRHNSEMDFPDYYESTYHTSAWVREHWASHFDVIDVIKGDDAARYLSADLALTPAGNVPHLRPMGQDLVIAVSR